MGAGSIRLEGKDLAQSDIQYTHGEEKKLDKFFISRERWQEHAADRAGWRDTLRCGLAPPEFGPRPPSPQPPSPRNARNKPTRAAAVAAAADFNVTNHFYTNA